jgi:hypothetical protein
MARSRMRPIRWGREMLRNYRPDIATNPDYGWRYVQAVATDVKYGSGDQKYDRPELQHYQNIIMNGGICGRRAFFGRFILRAFGIPTTARPSADGSWCAGALDARWLGCLAWAAGGQRMDTTYAITATLISWQPHRHGKTGGVSCR